jgi:hypothetical protein
LDAALSVAESVLTERDQTFATLQASHSLIPALLKQRADADAALGEVERTGDGDLQQARDRLAGIEQQLQIARRSRHSSIAALTGDHDQKCRSAAAVLEEARGPFVSAAVDDLRRRYADAVRALRLLWREQDVLSGAARVEIDLPLPVKVTGGVPPPSYDWWPRETLPLSVTRDTGDDTAQAAPIPIDPLMARCGAAMDRLSDAQKVAGGLRGAMSREQELSRDHVAMVGFNPHATYRTLRPFMNHFDSLEHQPGDIVDSGLTGVGALSRLFRARVVASAVSTTRETAAPHAASSPLAPVVEA